MRKLLVTAVVAAILLLPSIGASWSNASGPQWIVTLFNSDRHPDVPLNHFAAGRLGLIKPTWAHSYLYVTYRYLVGKDFNPAEQKALVSFWNRRLGLETGATSPERMPAAQWLLGVGGGNAHDLSNAELQWLAERNRVPGVAISDGMIGAYRSAKISLPGNLVSGFYFQNCNASSFLTATATLQTMADKFGIASPQVKQWVAAQDRVFDNCSNSSLGVFPASLNPNVFFQNVHEWTTARSKVPDVPAVASAFNNGCMAEGFKTAAIELDAMIQKLGASSPQVKQWVEAQDRAFAKCSGGGPSAANASTPPKPDIPHPLTNGTPFEQAQRTYQIACAYFYSGDYNKAAQMFTAIGADPSSPWHQWGAYLAARATIRKATLSGPKNDPALLAKAAAQLKAIIAGTAGKQIKFAAKRLLSFVDFRLDPQKRVEEVERLLLQPDSPATLAQNLSDYVGMLEDSTKNADGFYADDMTDWIASFSSDRAAEAHSISQWKKTGSMPWLVAAIAGAPASDPDVPALIAAAEKVKPDSPAYVTVTFHTARLLFDRGQIDQARAKLDTLLTMRDRMPISTVNEIAALRMRMARNLNELLTYALRTPLGVTDTGDGNELPSSLDVKWLVGANRLKRLLAGPLFDRDGAEVLNQWIPLSLQTRAAQSPILPDDLRAQMALAVWTKAILLHDNASAREIAPVVIKLVPKLKAQMSRWMAARNPQAQQFDAAFMMLTHPGIRPYIDPGVGRTTPLDKMNAYRDNWWRFPPWYEMALSSRGRHSPPATYPLFLSAAQKKSAEDQWRKLSSINAPNLLCSAAIAEARSNPGDNRVPQALSQCIAAVHFGCSNSRGTHYASLAYYLLHRNYPDSEWSLKNRFWYRGTGCEMPS